MVKSLLGFGTVSSPKVVDKFTGCVCVGIFETRNVLNQHEYNFNKLTLRNAVTVLTPDKFNQSSLL